MKKVLALFFALNSAFYYAQDYTHQVIIVNEGYFDYQTNEILTPVSIGSYSLANNVYTEMAVVENMRFASDALIKNEILYLAADSKILKYNLNTFELIDEVSLPGVRNLGIFNDYLVATRGEYQMSFDSYLKVYNTNDLSLVYSFDTLNGPKWATQNISIYNDIAYVAVNNAYVWGEEKGIIGQLNLSNMTYGNELSLGENGKNPDNMFINGDFLYTVNNKDWSGASVSKVSLGQQSIETVDIANAITGCGTSALRDDRLIYQISMETSLNEYDLDVMNNIGPVNNHTMNYYELAQNPVDGNLFASETDFFSFGTVHIFNSSNEVLNSFSASVSPGIILFDNRPLSNSLEESNSVEFSAYPNPTSEIVQFSGKNACIAVYNISGEELFRSTESKINISELPSGVYIAKNDNGSMARFIVR